MSVWLPWWGWAIAALALGLSWFFAYGCGHVNGEWLGIDSMKREAIHNGAAKACDFESGWRWWTREELASRANTPDTHALDEAAGR